MRLTNQKGENLSPAEMKNSAGNYFKIGLGIVAVGLAFLLWNSVNIFTTTSTIGTVISNECSTNRVAGTNESTTTRSCTPTFSFTDDAGILHEAPASSSSATVYPTNADFTIGYKPDDFSAVYITDWGRNIKYPLIFFAIAGFVFWMSASIRKTGREWDAEQKNG